MGWSAVFLLVASGPRGHREVGFCWVQLGGWLAGQVRTGLLKRPPRQDAKLVPLNEETGEIIVPFSLFSDSAARFLDTLLQASFF